MCQCYGIVPIRYSGRRVGGSRDGLVERWLSSQTLTGREDVKAWMGDRKRQGWGA